MSSTMEFDIQLANAIRPLFADDEESESRIFKDQIPKSNQITVPKLKCDLCELSVNEAFMLFMPNTNINLSDINDMPPCQLNRITQFIVNCNDNPGKPMFYGSKYIPGMFVYTKPHANPYAYCLIYNPPHDYFELFEESLANLRSNEFWKDWPCGREITQEIVSITDDWYAKNK